MGKQTLDEFNKQQTIEKALLENVNNEWDPILEGATMCGLDTVHADRIEMWYHQLTMRLRQNKVSIDHLTRLVLGIYDDFVYCGLRDKHGLEPAEQMLCRQLAILTALVDAEFEAANS